MVEISFSTKGIGALLPIPSSTVGELHWDDSDSFRVDIGNTTKEDFEAYISECMEAGFYVDYEKDNDSYFAYDSAGIYLSIYYEEGNMIEIQIHD